MAHPTTPTCEACHEQPPAHPRTTACWGCLQKVKDLQAALTEYVPRRAKGPWTPREGFHGTRCHTRGYYRGRRAN